MTRRLSFFLPALLIVGILTAAPAPEKVSLTFLSTTDLHGRIEAWDYFANKPDNLGLVKIATLIKQARKEAPDALLVDVGDMVQDPQSVLTNYFLARNPKKLNPTVAVMNQLRYDAMAVGNHEFNYAPEPMWTIKGASAFPWLCANLKQTYTEGVPYFPPYIIKTVKGIRVGIVAFVAPVAAPTKDYQFEPILQAAKRVIPELRPKVDLVLVLLHSGFVHDPVGEQSVRVQVEGENVAPEMAEQVPGIDVIMYGHAHSELSEKFINGVLLTEAKYWAQSLARADVTMEKGAEGRWVVTSKHSRTIPVTAAVPADPAVAQLVQPYRQELEHYLDTPIATATKALAGGHGRYEDSPMLDLIQEAQMEAGHADLSLAYLLNEQARIAPGPVTIRHVGSLYPASNNIAVVEMTGAQLKDALEHSASFFPSWPVPRGEALRLPALSPDQASGVSYVVDLTRPVGDRIRDLQFRGSAIDPARKFRVAVSPARRQGEDGYAIYKGLPTVARTGDMREVLVEHVTRTRTIPADTDGNWKIVPAEAVAAMEKLADAGAAAHKKK